MAREWGLDPKDSRINWSLATEGTHSPSVRLARVNKHFATLTSARPAAQAKRPVPQATSSSAPPVENGPGPSTFSDGSYEALLDDIATRRKTPGQGREIASRNGWTI